MAMTSRGPFQQTALCVRGQEREEHKKGKSRLLLLKNRGQVKGRKHSEFRASGSHSAAANSSDKHRQGKRKKSKTLNPNQVRYNIESYKEKLSDS